MPVDVHELCARYRKLFMPAVCDALYALGLPEPILPTALRPLLPETKVVGHAFTLEGRAIEPFVGWDDGIGRIKPYLAALAELTPDSVLVSVNPASHVGHFGELTGNAAQQRGCQGVILDGNLRDIAGLREIGLQVFYRDLSPRNAIGRWEMIAKQQPVTIGGVRVTPGDIVFAEFDGVLVIPAADAERVLDKAEEIATAEESVRAEMRAGSTPIESLDRHGHI